MKFIHLFISMLVFGASAFAQSRFYQSHDWEKAPQLTARNEKYKGYDFYSVLEKRIIEFAYNANNELTMFETRHIKIHVNTDKGVESRNKMYISTSSVIEMINLKARCISPSGKIINLDKSNIKQVDDLENKGPYTIFAFEGMSPDCDIEYLYTAKYYLKTARMLTTQYSFPQQSISIDFVSPKNLVFELKSYNGFPEFKSDTSNQEINHLTLQAHDIGETVDEKYSAGDAEEQYFAYNLRYNTVKGKSKLYTWNLIGNDLVESYGKVESGDSKAIGKLIDKSGARKQSSELEKLMAFENYFKKNIQQITDPPEKLTIEKALDKKQVTSYMASKVFIEAAKQLGITYEMIFSCNRFECAFDGAFEGYNQLDDLLLYYPSLSKYQVPDNAYSRIGFIPYQYLGNKGLFVKATEVAGVTAAISKVKTIGYPDNSLSQSTINASIRFSDADFLPSASVSNIYTGYTSYNIQPVFYLLDKDQKKQVTEGILKQPGEETIVKSSKTENEAPENAFKLPFIVSGEVELPQLMEKAGNKFLFKVGLIIGPQAEMYQDEVRKTDMVIEYPHGFIRNLEIAIPEGYKISNLETLKFNIVLKEEDKETAFFKSDYQLSGSKLTINVSEQYNNIRYPKSVYKDFKAVINAAADFNKVTLIFEKI